MKKHQNGMNDYPALLWCLIVVAGVFMFTFASIEKWNLFALCWVIIAASAFGLIMHRRRKLGLSDHIDNEKIVVYAEGIAERLEQKGLIGFLLEDYPVNTKFSKEIIKDDQQLEKTLNSIVNDLLEYLQLPHNVILRVQRMRSSRSYEEMSKVNAAEYTSYFAARIIRLNIMEYYKPEQIVAILCHECSHYFMEYHKLNWCDTFMNEERTDVLANLIGFNILMLKGYETNIYVESTTSNSYMRTFSTVGYITDRDCADLRVFLRRYRRQAMEKQKQEDRMNKLKEEYMRKAEAAEYLVERIELLDITHNTNNSPESIADIQQVLADMGSRNLYAELQVINRQANSSTAEKEICQAVEKLDRFCTELLNWVRILS